MSLSGRIFILHVHQRGRLEPQLDNLSLTEQKQETRNSEVKNHTASHQLKTIELTGTLLSAYLKVQNGTQT